MQPSLEGIKSRWAVLSFDKVFKENADASSGKKEADSRFRYDPTFLHLRQYDFWVQLWLYLPPSNLEAAG